MIEILDTSHFILAAQNLVPGLNTSYISLEAHEIVINLHKVVLREAKFLLKILLIVSLGISLFSNSPKFSFGNVIRQAFVGLFIFLAIPTIFGKTIEIGAGFANKIYPKDKVNRLAEDFNKSAVEQRDETSNGGETKKEVAWYQYLFAILAASVPVVGQAPALIMLLAVIFFYIISVGVNILWLILVIVLYVFAPILVIFAVLPGLGVSIALNWYGAVLQLGILRIWLAVCAFMIDNAGILFLNSNNILDIGTIENRFTASIITVVFSVLYLLGPILIARFVPISQINSGITQGLVGTAYVAYNQAQNVAKAAAAAAL